MKQMDILIDSQKVITINVEVVESEGDLYHVPDFDGIYKIIDTWRELDPKKRAYGWGSDEKESDLIVTWYSEASGLMFGSASAFWDGRGTWNTHSLEAVDELLPIGALEYESLIDGGQLEIVTEDQEFLAGELNG